MFDQIIDHALQAHMHAVFRGINPGHAVSLQLLDFGRHNHPAATAKDLDFAAAIGFQQVDHVLEEFNVPALIGGDRNALHVFLQSGIDDFLHRAVMPEVNHLGTGGLHNPPHDVDRRVMAVKQRGGGNEAQLVLGFVRGKLLGNSKISHGNNLNRISEWRSS